MSTPSDAVEVSSERVSTGSVASRIRRDDASFVLYYGSEQRGSLDVCGCPYRPLGGLPRVSGYVERSARRSGAPYLLLNAGEWLDDTIGLEGSLRSDVVLQDRYLVEGLSMGGWSALNVTYRDLPFLAVEGVPETAVSAVVGGVTPYRVMPVGDLMIAVTGITPKGATFLEPEGFSFRPIGEALDAVLPDARARADLVVVLAYDLGRMGREIARRGDIDVLVEAGAFEMNFDAEAVGDTIWVRTRNQTKRLGELRLWWEDGAIVRAVDRKIDLDSRIPSDRTLARLKNEQKRDVDAARVEVFGPW